MIYQENKKGDGYMWNKQIMDLEGLKSYANWVVNQMENTVDDYKYAEYEELLFTISMDIKELEEQEK